jgi:hypothetical protein
MSKFKVGDDVKVIGLSKLLHPGVKIGDVRTVTATCSNGVQLDGFSDGWVYDIHIETLKPKWSIYNNTLPWSQLSDKQKGKMLLARNSKIKFTCNKVYVSWDVAFNNEGGIYKAQYIEPVKPEPTMTQLFVKDWNEVCDNTIIGANKMIARGWTKTCK